jgi:threonyl-tRNA synthetase
MSITITLPDTKKLTFPAPVTLADVAEKISPSLKRATVAGKVDGQLVDLSYKIKDNMSVKLLTDRDAESLDILRHSTAHLLAHAVKNLYKNVEVVIGPVIEGGFYYDFATTRPFTPEDLLAIETEMRKLAKAKHSIKRFELSTRDAIDLFKKRGERYKVKLIEEIPAGETITLYQQDDFIDLCRGPHFPSTEKLCHFKLTKISGAYWRGDAKNEMLQRIYGTAFFHRKDLSAYLHLIEEAKKRDHRRLGKLLNLFHFQEEAPGMAFWHSSGYRLYTTILAYMRKKLTEYQYEEIYTPMMADRVLWEKSGHWDKFGQEGMFLTASENRQYVIKPMNCPGHVQIFNQGIKSYRDLPIRLAEFGLCHRNEPSGTLHGLMRIREFIQDDAHVFCTKSQLLAEIETLIHMVHEIYRDFGFEQIIVRLATRPKKRIGNDEVWDESEKALETALRSKGVSFELAPEEGAFYGPKIEFHLRDCLNRIWQCGTIQVDFSMPNRLGAHYIAQDGSRQIPIMIHRAILGSIERFVGILLEHYSGWLPLWLAPIQIVVMNITDSQSKYTQFIAENLKKTGFYVKTDLRNEKISFKIREHTLTHIPYQLVIGDREVERQTISVRHLTNNRPKEMTLSELIKALQFEIEEKAYR